MDEMDRNGESDAKSDLFWENELSMYSWVAGVC